MDMLAEFLDIRKDSASLFDGLYISQRKDICDLYMNQYPVISVTFATVDKGDYQQAHVFLCNVISELYKNNSWLKESGKLTDAKKELFERIEKKKATDEEYLNGLSSLADMMRDHYDKQVILLIDEYDVPIATASSHGFYGPMLDDMKSVLKVLKYTKSVKYAVVTGCLQIAKESIFTGTNNFSNYTVLDKRFSDCFGFTQDEVDRMLQCADLSAYGEKIREWYDGYIFGDTDIYCPWDVMMYVNEVILDPNLEPQYYWENSSGNEIIADFLKKRSFVAGKDFETLLSGGCIVKNISSKLTYNLVGSSDDNFWSLLFFTGYLTTREKGSRYSESIPLKIPNKEIMVLFDKKATEWFTGYAEAVGGADLYKALWSGDTQAVQEFINIILLRSISYHDYHENFYHGIVLGLLTNPDYGYLVESNIEKGSGRPDIIVQDIINRRAIVLEFKTAKTEDSLDAESIEALDQIEREKYAEGVMSWHFKKAICYGIAFYHKRCIVKKEVKQC